MTVVATTSSSSSTSNTSAARSVDKVFEDAELSGVLLLAGRKLKDFPTHIAAKHDLSDTISADLSHNRLVEFPTSLCEYGYLESLRLAHNCLRSLPVTVQLLESLTYLDLSRNHLTTLPPALCVLPLEVLLLGNNRLEYIPREIRQLADTLAELDISCNRLTYVPPDLGLLKCLRVLNMRENLLTDLPSELCRLRLRILNMSSNKIGQLPLELRLMNSLVELAIDGNPLTSPPAKLCVKGRVHAFKWLEVDAAHKGGRKHLEWPGQRPVSITGGTLGRSKKTTAADDYKYVLEKKAERRGRSSRFNTIGGDSGYSTVDEQNRLSQDMSNGIAAQNGSAASATAGVAVKLRRASPVGEEAPPLPPDYNSLTNGVAPNIAVAVTVTSFDQPRPVPILPSPSSDTAHRVIRSAFDNPNNSDQRIAGGLVEEVMNACSTHLNGLQTPQRVRLASPEHDGSPTPRAPSDRESSPKIAASVNPRAVNRVLDLSNVTTTTKRTMRSDEIQSIYTGGKSRGQADGVGLSPVMESPIHVAAPFPAVPSTHNHNNNNNYNKPKTPPPPPPPPPAQAPPLSPPMGAIEALGASSIVAARTAEKTSNGTPTPRNEPPSATVKNANSTTSPSVPNGKPPMSPIVSHSVKTTMPAKSTAKVASTTASNNFTRNGSLSSSQSSVGSSKSSASSLQANGRPGRGPPPPPVSLSSTRPKPRDSLGTARTVEMRKVVNSDAAIDHMRKTLETRLGITLPVDRDELATTLSDGVHLCTFINQLRIRAVPSVHTPLNETSPLSIAKSKRNVENFLIACRRLGLPESQLCSSADVQDKKNLSALAKTTAALVKQLGMSPTTNSAVVRKDSGCSSVTARKQPSVAQPRAAPKISSV